MNTKFFYCFFIFIFHFGCKKEKEPFQPKPVTGSLHGKVFIINEGNFQWANASVSLYNSNNGEITEDIFKNNNGKVLGDVCQSMAVYDGKFFIVVNNSSKIEITDTTNFKTLGTISGLTSPRYFLGITLSKAYITDYKAKGIWVVDLSLNSVVKKINCSGWTEELIKLGEKVYVTNMAGEYLFVLDTKKDEITDSIKISLNSNSIKSDKNGKVWVLCVGDKLKNKRAGLHQIDPLKDSVLQSFYFPTSEDYPLRLSINSLGDSLYYLNKHVYRFTLDIATLPQSPVILSNGNNYYGLGIEPLTGKIYVADAADYTQKGTVLIYNSGGNFFKSFKVGIIPGDFLFF